MVNFVRICLLTIFLCGCSNKECIVDIYHSPNREQRYIDAVAQYDYGCYHTITECEGDCGTLYLKRSQYDVWAKQYRDLGLEPPYPKRTDTENLKRN